MESKPICKLCKHFTRKSLGFSCKAFSTIPDKITQSKTFHQRHIEGDKGIKFELLSPEEIKENGLEYMVEIYSEVLNPA